MSRARIQLESVVELVTLLVGEVTRPRVISLIVLHFLEKVCSVCLHKHSKVMCQTQNLWIQLKNITVFWLFVFWIFVILLMITEKIIKLFFCFKLQMRLLVNFWCASRSNREKVWVKVILTQACVPRAFFPCSPANERSGVGRVLAFPPFVVNSGQCLCPENL